VPSVLLLPVLLLYILRTSSPPYCIIDLRVVATSSKSFLRVWAIAGGLHDSDSSYRNKPLSIANRTDLSCGSLERGRIMERTDEEGDTQESSRRGAGQVRRAGAQRGQAAGQSGKWPQGRPSQKPQEGQSGALQCTSAAPWASEELVIKVMMLILARHGEWAIGRGDRGIRYRAVVQ